MANWCLPRKTDHRGLGYLLHALLACGWCRDHWGLW